MTTTVDIRVADLRLTARLETAAAPRTCAAFLTLLPLHANLLQARWSGESAWVPLGDTKIGLGPENPTSHPSPGQLLLYPGGLSETEILFPYGATLFASKVGQLAGNHFATLEEGRDQLAEIGRLVVWRGAQDVTFEARPLTSGLDRLNRLPTTEAEQALIACCRSPRWAAQLAAGRPYESADALRAAAARVWWALDESDWRDAFAAHPRIGDLGHTDPIARSEQRGVGGADAGTLAALASANAAYEERFGRVFLVCATGRSAEDMLALLRQRMANDPQTELRVAAGEQARITDLRLERLLR